MATLQRAHPGGLFPADTSLYQLSQLGVNYNHYKSKPNFADVFSHDNITIMKFGRK